MVGTTTGNKSYTDDSISVYCDGLCEPINPGGIATYGFAVFVDGEIIHRESGVVGEGQYMSNNVAEYSALCTALHWLLGKKLQHCVIRVLSDSRLLVNQMSGKWKSHEGLYKKWYIEAKRLAKEFAELQFQWIPREQNKLADSLSREAYFRYSENREASDFLQRSDSQN